MTGDDEPATAPAGEPGAAEAADDPAGGSVGGGSVGGGDADTGSDAGRDADSDTDAGRPVGVLGWVGAVVAVAVVVGLVTWIVLGRIDRGTDVATLESAAVAASTEDLAALPGRIGHAVYWAGPRDGVTYELTETPDGGVYIRYLSGGAEVGTPDPGYLVVATYPDTEAYATVTAAAARAGATSTTTQSGALVVTSPDTPTSAFFAFRDVPFVVEVYDPEPGRARTLVESGQVQPLR